MSTRDLALPDVATLERLVAQVIEAGGHASYGDVVTILVGDVDLEAGTTS